MFSKLFLIVVILHLLLNIAQPYSIPKTRKELALIKSILKNPEHSFSVSHDKFPMSDLIDNFMFRITMKIYQTSIRNRTTIHQTIDHAEVRQLIDSFQEKKIFYRL